MLGVAAVEHYIHELQVRNKGFVYRVLVDLFVALDDDLHGEVGGHQLLELDPYHNVPFELGVREILYREVLELVGREEEQRSRGVVALEVDLVGVAALLRDPPLPQLDRVLVDLVAVLHELVDRVKVEVDLLGLLAELVLHNRDLRVHQRHCVVDLLLEPLALVGSVI